MKNDQNEINQNKKNQKYFDASYDNLIYKTNTEFSILYK